MIGGAFWNQGGVHTSDDVFYLGWAIVVEIAVVIGARFAWQKLE
ncbi:hypothetical protein [Maricaulis maris]